MTAEEFYEQTGRPSFRKIGAMVVVIDRDRIFDFTEKYAEQKLQEYKDSLEEIKQRTKKIW